MNFSINLAKALIESTEEFPVDFDDAWQWIGYTRKDSAKEKLTRNFEKDLDYSAIWRSVAHSKGSTASRSEKIFLTVDAFKSFCMMAGTEKGKEIRKYFLECEKIAKQAIVQQVSPTLSLAPFWYQRLVLFRSQNKVAPGYFSIFEETITLVSDLETAGYIIPDNAIPDISIGLCWAKHLRSEGIEPNEITVTYPHQYPDGRKVDANSYSEDMLPKFRRWFRETYKPVKLPTYLGNKDKDSLPALSKCWVYRSPF